MKTKDTYFEYTADENDQKQRLDVFLAEKMKISRSLAQKQIKDGIISVNKEQTKKTGYLLKKGDLVQMVSVNFNNTEQTSELAVDETDLSIDIVAETENYLVINKPAGILVHETEKHEKNTLVSWIIKKYPQIKKVGENPSRPGIVHRLDKEASGILVVAKNKKMYEFLKKQFQNRTVEKHYSVLVYGAVDKDHGVLDFPIDRGPDGKSVARPVIKQIELRNVTKVQPGREAITDFIVEKRYIRFTLLDVSIHTGRTHQIRVHMFAFNHPVVGDRLYFNKKLFKKGDKKIDRLFLHSKKICFNDLSGEKVCYEAELPAELSEYLKGLR